MAVYAAMVDLLDQNVGKVIRQLKESGEYDNTLIVFISDNGPEGQHVASRGPLARDNSVGNIGRASSYAGYGPNWAQVSALPHSLFKGHSYEGGISVPAIVRAPASLGAQAGRLSAAPGHVTDIVPTLLELAGVQHPAQTAGSALAPLQGASMVPLLQGRSPAIRVHFEQGWELFGRKAYREGRWKIVYGAPPLGTGDWQLFDLQRDPGEQHDLARAQPRRLAQLKAGYQRYVQANGVVEVPGLAERIGERYSPLGHFESLE